MATVSPSAKDTNENRRKRVVLLSSLPPDFLRINTTPKQLQQEAADQQAAIALHHQFVDHRFFNTAGRLNITVAQAKLVKSYSMMRMDPYVRLRVGHCIYETQTDPNGGKNPHWNKEVQCAVPHGVNSIYIEIYDERSFTMDELIAWAHIPIPQNVMAGETCENWYPLTGKQGEGKEGRINLVLSYISLGRGLNPCVFGNSNVSPPVMMIPSTASNMFGLPHFEPVPVYTQLAVPPVHNNQDLAELEQMFPHVEKETIKSVYEMSRGDKKATINFLFM
ncbi:toll-interacting protein-like [Cimex lectularius]|uniref:Toll-interacting protein n=1 Tax=Cimex lectularius TaxID=79782 RepID=A0A8I6RNP7_CIMLE|nr:toll-interacting protein-like [Cimex lectularius]